MELAIPPVSQQARSESKAAFQAAVRKELTPYQFFLSGEVSVTVEWTVNEYERYETDRSPDVDNILKPLLDALTGPSGIIIDDNQIQHVSCHWDDTTGKDERLTVRIGYTPDEWLHKRDLFFVQLENALCVPLSCDMPPEFQQIVIERYLHALKTRRDALDRGIDFGSASVVMPVQRMFHRTRLRGFRVLSLDEFRSTYQPPATQA